MSKRRTPTLLPTISANASTSASPSFGTATTTNAPAPIKSAAPSPAVVQTVWARTLMDGLRRAGVTRAVVSPGSRSTPFTLAAEHVGMDTCNIIDERSAAFFALGCARASGQPVLMICTSGTAGAHYYPAIIEAAYSHLPLIALTADRPPELWDCGAPQTIDQAKLFGEHVRAFIDLGLPDGSHSSLRALCRKAAQAAYCALAPVPGPVHINACARKPFEPILPVAPDDIALIERSEHILRSFQPRAAPPRCIAPDETIASLARACAAAARGLIIAGPIAPGPTEAANRYVRAIRDLARTTGFPLLTEAASQIRFAPIDDSDSDSDNDNDEASIAYIDAFDLLVADHDWATIHQPELVLQIGAPPTSGAWARYMQRNLDSVHCIIASHGWNDPHASADLSVFGEPADIARHLIAHLQRDGASSISEARASWTAMWTTANRRAWQVVDEILSSAPNRDDERYLDIDAHEFGMPEGAAMRAAVTGAPRGAWLLLGNSLPIRTVDTYVPQHRAATWVLSQRGANGIDGFLSSAAGAAWLRATANGSHSKPAVVAIIGDVTFLHDLGGLRAAASARTPVCVVVIDNDGGRIFEHLPIARATYGVDRAVFETHFLTRPTCDMAAAAAVFGATFAQVRTPDALAHAVANGCLRPGLTLVHALVEPESSYVDRRRIERALGRSLAGASEVEEAE